MLNIIDLFEKKELKEKGDSNFQTTCPDCGLQGGRTEGFILFPETNTAYCHSSHKWFTLLQTAGLKFGIIKCIEGNDKGEIPKENEELNNEIYDIIEEEYGKNFLTELKLSMGNVEDFLIVKIGARGKITRSVNIDKVANYIINKHDIKTIYGLKEESIYIYKDGIWSITGRGLIKYEIEKILDIWAKNNVVNEIIEKIKRKTETTREDFEIVPEFKRCFLNCVLDIENVDNVRFLPHSKEYNFKTKFPIEYNPKAKCQKIIKFIEEIFYPEDILQVQEWFGHHLPKRYFFKKAVIIHGLKNTGKSVFLNLLSEFVGRNNITDISLQKISVGRSFDLLFLKDMFANIHDDLSSKDLNDGGGFKMAVGDGYIAGEEKFGALYRFRNSAKMTFACNKIPPVRDIDDDAYYDRWLTWKLDNILSLKQINKNLIHELTTQEELSGLLNWALEGYFRLVKQNHFTNQKESEEIKELMIQHGNPLARFVSEILKQEIGNKITKEEMYKQYCHYCISQKPKLSPCSKDQLGKQLPRFAPYIYNGKSTSERYWLNGKFNLCVNMTAETPFKKPLESKKIHSNNVTKVKHINFPKVSLPPLKNEIKNISKVSKKIVKKKSDREVQFYNAKECEDIKPTHTKKEVLKFIKEHPKDNYKKIHKIFGIGFYKFINQLRKEGKIK